MICLTPTEVERRFEQLGIPNRFSNKEKEAFETTAVVDRGDRVFGFPIPEDPSGLNILNLRRIVGTDPTKQPSFFDHPWYLAEPFATVDCAPGWHFIRMDVLPDSLSQPWDYARSLASQHLELPSAVEVALMLFLHFIGSGEQLLQKKHTWCSDHASFDRLVTVGAFGRNGLFVSGHPAGYASRGLGICAKFRNAPDGGFSG